MTRQTIYRGQYSNWRAASRRRRRLLNLSCDEGDRLLYPTRGDAATCPMHRDKGSAAVFKGLSLRIRDLADLRKLPREWPFHRVLGPSRTPCRNKRFQRFGASAWQAR